jgi:hypothetical protein
MRRFVPAKTKRKGTKVELNSKRSSMFLYGNKTISGASEL